MRKGKRNKITDVAGVKVGHVTLIQGDIQTGVTALLPRQENIFLNKYLAASYVINGFGKSQGLVQVEEMGTLETPIILTNTLSVGTAYTGLVKYMLAQNPDIGESTGTVNPVIFECNDGVLNDIRGLHVTEAHVLEALETAGSDFDLGAVGAGRGMICHEMKGGIGSASRILRLGSRDYSLGVLVLTNHGLKRSLILEGKKQGTAPIQEAEHREKGSVITIIATDLPLSSRQLKRLCRRVPLGLAMTGSYAGNGSGEIAFAFSTANTVQHYPKDPIGQYEFMSHECLDPAFEALKEAVEESVLTSLYSSESLQGKGGKLIKSLKDTRSDL